MRKTRHQNAADYINILSACNAKLIQPLPKNIKVDNTETMRIFLIRDGILLR